MKIDSANNMAGQPKIHKTEVLTLRFVVVHSQLTAMLAMQKTAQKSQKNSRKRFMSPL